MRREIEIWENERYQPIGNAFSAAGLLPTDRNKFSLMDGSVSWKALNEAESAMVSAGWQWINDWVVLPIDQSMSEVGSSGIIDKDESWIYGADFSVKVSEFSPTKSRTSFVRCRKMCREQIYQPILLVKDRSYFTCNYCDLEKLESLSLLFLTMLSQLSLSKHPRDINILKINNLKTMLHDALEFNNKKIVIDELEKHLEVCAKKSRDLWSMASSLIASNDADTLSKRTADLATHFTYDERNLLASLVIKIHDTENKYHCNIEGCNKDSCIFAPEVCRNESCGIIYSKIYFDRHDKICPQKIIHCDRMCGVQVRRWELARHMDGDCGLKPVLCPFAKLGCPVIDLVQRDLKKHLDDDLQSHLLLVGAKLVDQDAVLTSFLTKFVEVGESVASHAVQIKAAQASIGITMALIEQTREKANKDTHDAVGSLHTKIHDRLAHKAESSEISRLNQEIVKLNTELAKHKNAINDLIKSKK